MAHFDIFNGDADGIFSLIQLRKDNPIDSLKITGVKRDILLLEKCVATQGDSITVLDISMERNQQALNELLAKNVKVFYADHHRKSDITSSNLLDAHIDLSPEICTSLIIDKILNGKYRLWAIAGAYGDNLISVADKLCEESKLSKEQRDFLLDLGTLVNYNGYGLTTEDLHFEPAKLFDLLINYDSPFELLADKHSPYHLLKSAFNQDINQIDDLPVHYIDGQLSVLILPNEAYSRRVSGVLSNRLANSAPDKAHIVLTTNKDDSYTVSLRAPMNNKQGADVICSSFETGGGRASAAGINKLQKNQLDLLIQKASEYYQNH